MASRPVPPVFPKGVDPLFLGLTGSYAYGMATTGSDLDWRGVFAHPTERWLGLHDPPVTIVAAEGDSTWWELRHFAGMLLKGSVNAHELLWLPSGCVRHSSGIWDTLVSHRKEFFSKRLYDGWVGVASGYRHELDKRGPHWEERGKHAAHLWRFSYGLLNAMHTGRMEVDVSRWANLLLNIRSGSVSAAEAIAASELHLRSAQEIWEQSQPWPPQPNSELLNSLVRGYRLALLRQSC